MGKPIVRDFTQGKGILKFFPYEGAACLVPQTMVTSADTNGMKIVPAGTPFPSNDAECKGYLLHDVDVTMGDAPGTYVYQELLIGRKLSHFQSQMKLELQHLELLSMARQRL